MKRISKTLAAAGMACFLLQGCTGIGTISREDKLAQGAIAGAIVGGALGYEVFGSGSGQLLGLAINPYARAPDARSQTDAVDQAPPENDARHAPFADLAERLRDRK